MNRRTLFLVMLAAMLLVACQNKNPISHSEFEDETGSAIDIYNFAFIKHAPESKKKQDINDVIKLYFIENDTGFAIDIENNFVYIDPRIGSRGVRRTNDDSDELQDTQKFIDLLKEYDVQNWKKRYSDANDDEDGYGWKLIVQYADGSTEQHSGSGTDMEKITPDNFHPITKDLAEIVEKELVEDK